MFHPDSVAVPDFAAGAMENWGLILYRETAFLYDPKVSSESNKKRVCTVVAHEVAHQVHNLGHVLASDWLAKGHVLVSDWLGKGHVLDCSQKVT